MAGVGYRLKAAFDKFSTRYKVRAVRGTNNYIDYPGDLTWMGNNELVNHLYDRADIIHIAEYPWIIQNSTPKIWRPVRKPTVIHQHGTPFRNNPKMFLDIARREGYQQIVSTVDLLVDDSLVWIPNPVDVDDMRDIRRKNYPKDGVFRVGQAPTNRSIKNTSDYIAAAERIKADRRKFDYFVLEKLKWVDTLRYKAQCDLWFDQLTFGYGNNGIEAMAMGIPVMGNFSDPSNFGKIKDLTGLDIPMIWTQPESIEYYIRWFMDRSEDLRRMANLSKKYIDAVHEESKVVERLEAVYDRF